MGLLPESIRIIFVMVGESLGEFVGATVGESLGKLVGTGDTDGSLLGAELATTDGYAVSVVGAGLMEGAELGILLG